MSKTTAKAYFGPEELEPQTGSPHPVTSAEKLFEMRARETIVRSIYVQNPNHTPVFKSLDMVLSLGEKGVFQTGVRNAAPSFAGKSEAGDEFGRIIVRRGTYPAGTLPIRRVELEQACTPRRFWLSILAIYGDGFAASKDEDGLRRSTYDAFERFGTKLLLLDEIQHAGYRSHGSSAPTDVIKRFISDAQVGIGLFGNEDALTLLQSNDQLSNRLIEPCDIQPLKASDTQSSRRLTRFLARYDAALVEKELFASSTALADPRTIECMMSLSKGYLGRVVKMLQIAGRQAFLRGATSIEFCDLSHAAISWAVAQKLASHDPFRFGISMADAS
ncbi:TniB family NTP-binding protein [Qipengyuania spongiae]|uniref:TniB family NTP-binding protein n=1 Tax=Qipengyuania spongiae TaxID=2909673 RepID=A0ABY5SVY9_9SPHN|nr:TniB family NTP-binding protein [Qipengyuania spongiae]UVI38369.1 TniB family NTP-binding protein [Qipengyuania spongiae]